MAYPKPISTVTPQSDAAGSRPLTLGEMEPIGDRNIRSDQSHGYHSYPPHLKAKYVQYVQWLKAQLESKRRTSGVSSMRTDTTSSSLRPPHFDPSQQTEQKIATVHTAGVLETSDQPASRGKTTQDSFARPLSATEFGRPVPAPAVAFPAPSDGRVPISVAAWSLPDFHWPRLVDEIIDQPIRNYPVFARSLVSSASRFLSLGAKRLGIVGLGRNQGTSFISMLVARGLQSVGSRVLLIDGDVTSPGLTSTLGLSSKVSWHGLLRMSGPSAEAIVQSERTGVCLMPLSCNLSHLKKSAGLLEGLSSIVSPVVANFDAIVIDLGPTTQLLEELPSAEALVDSAFLVQNVQKSNQQKYIQARNDLRMFGISKLIVAQNFVQQAVV